MLATHAMSKERQVTTLFYVAILVPHLESTWSTQTRVLVLPLQCLTPKRTPCACTTIVLYDLDHDTVNDIMGGLHVPHDIINNFGGNGSAHALQLGSSPATGHALLTCHTLINSQSVCMCVYMHVFIIYITLCLSLSHSVCISLHLSVYLSVYLPTYASVIIQSFVRQLLNLSIYVICKSVFCQSVSQSVSQSVCMYHVSIYISVSTYVIC